MNNLKLVSFEVAKAIKDAGYPQGDKNSGLTNVYPLEDHDDNFTPYTRIGKLTTNYHCRTFRILSDIPFVVVPTYIEVWMWLSKEKEIYIDTKHEYNDNGEVSWWNNWLDVDYSNQEEAIIGAIEHLVSNNLIKI